jgi:transposase
VVLYPSPMTGRGESDPDRIAAIMIGFPDAHVLSVSENKSGLWVEVETRDEVGSCPACGNESVADSTRLVEREGLPVFGRALHLSWRVRGWRCVNPGCPTDLWFEKVPQASKGPRIRGG